MADQDLNFVQAQGGPVPDEEFEHRLSSRGGLPGEDPAFVPLIIGDKSSAGTGTADTVYGPVTLEQIEDLAGAGSPLHCQAASFRNYRNPEVGFPKGPMYILPLAEITAGVPAAAEQTLTFATNASGPGWWIFKIGGHKVRVAAFDGQTPTEAAAAFVAAYDGLEWHEKPPVSVAAVAGVVTLTGTVDGSHLNDIGLEVYEDPDVTMTATLSDTTMGGAGGTPGAGVHSDTSLASARTAMSQVGDAGIIVHPWNYQAANDEILEQANDDANATNQHQRTVVTAYEGTLSGCSTWLGQLRANHDAERLMANVTRGTGMWPGERAARAAATLAAEVHVGRSLDGLEDDIANPPSSEDNWKRDELTQLINAGGTPWRVKSRSTRLSLCRAVMNRIDKGLRDFATMRVADLVRDTTLALQRARLRRASMVAEDAELPMAEHIVKPSTVAALYREALKVLENFGYVTEVDDLWETYVSNLDAETAEFSQGVQWKMVPQIHNFLTLGHIL